MDPKIRLAQREAAPTLMTLHRGLSRLSSVVTVMNTGAHPDDEQSGLLAWLRFGLGMRTVIACSTRGEGGQNALGPERGALLGVMRSREMEEAARVLDTDVAWIGFGPQDSVFDFGFSKDGDDTFARWDEDKVIDRLALAYRRYRPDAVIPTFLDVPGQHGHHRAMTRAAEAAIARAARPGPIAGSDLPPWQVTHYYLPAWSGGGATYDDTVAPPLPTLAITAGQRDVATGVPFSELGEWSRRRHASQGMGRWSDTPPTRWELHRLSGAPEARLAESVPQNLADLAQLARPGESAIALAAETIAQAQTAFPDRAAVASHLTCADAALEQALSQITPEFRAAHGHRLERKRREVAHALAEAAGLDLIATPEPAILAPGESGKVVFRRVSSTQTGPLELALRHPGGLGAAPIALADGVGEMPVEIAANAELTPQFFEDFDAMGRNHETWVEVKTIIAGRPVVLSLELEEPLQIRPAETLSLRPAAFVLRPGEAGPLTVRLDSAAPLEIDPPDGWSIRQDGALLTLAPPADAPAGLVTLAPRLNGKPAFGVQRADYPHTGPFAWHEPAEIRVLTVDLALPEGARIACIGDGDSTGLWLRRLGLDVTMLDSIAPDEDFSGYTTVLVGVMAFGSRPDLVAATARLHRFVEAGGHLVTLYQRPDRGWDAKTTPPRYLKVGTPSLRWRVTNPAAPVTILDVSHPLFSAPNQILPADFDGWDKERGLYFAADWDKAYEPLLSMADPGEDPLTGALISARIGKGRHSHVALVLHHQLDRLVPGAFRLLANLVSPAN